MNPRYTPILMFSLLLLALGASLYHKPAQAPQADSTMPALTLHALQSPTQSTPWQPTPGRMTLVNFFASWCVPCLAEHPQIKEFAAMKSLDVVGIAWNDRPENLEKWLKKNGNPYHSVWLDRGGEAAITMGIRGVPESFLIDGEGRVKLHIRGAIMPMQQKELSLMIRTMEAAHAPAR